MAGEPMALSGKRVVRGFTLIELLVVIGLIAGLAALFLGQLGGSGRAGALQSAQAEVANLISAAQTRAMATGQSVRVLVNVDPVGADEPSRYLRCLVLAEQVAGVWRAMSEVYLPEGVYVVPGNFSSIPAGLFPADAAARWTTADGAALRSTALRATNVIAESMNSATAERWAYLSLAEAGTTGSPGAIVLTVGARRSPGSYATGESPVELTAPEMVRGLKISTYGIATLIDGREGF